MRKRSLMAALAGVAMTATAVTGCSGSSSAGSGDAQDQTVTYMTWESNDTNKAIDASMKKFSDSSGLTVKREQSPNADYAQKLASLIMSKKAPDFFWCTTQQAQNLASEGLLYDFTDKLKAGGGLQEDKFSPGSLDAWRTKDGKLAGIPTMANTYGFFYNKEAFSRAGLDIPKAGWTYDDLFNDLAKLQKADPQSKQKPLVTQWQLLDSVQGVSAYAAANGGQPFTDADIGVTKVQADAKFREGAQKYADAIAAGQLTDPDYDASTAMAPFAKGAIPLMFGGQWLQQTIQQNHPKITWGYAPWPVGAVKSVQPVETNGVCSPATLSDPDATWKTISYLDGPGFAEAMKQAPIAPIAYEPGSTGYYEALEAGDAGDKSIAATAKYELAAKDKFMTQWLDPWATKAADVTGTAWNPALAGKKDLDAGIDATVNDIQRLIDQQE
ncbi:MAG TPA: extracellular solute-binding protein [Microlunatus sp.]